jgi:hypothetical protein
VPSGAPSKYPTTTHPTLSGETVHPTMYPTSEPTVSDKSYLTSQAYIEYQSALRNHSAIPNALSFSTFFYRAKFLVGTCPTWRTYTDTRLLLPFEDIAFTSAYSYYTIFDYNTQAVKRQLATCNNPRQVKVFIAALMARGEAEFNCNGVSWRVYQCNGNPIICNNCKKICVNSEACPGKSFTTNPCQQGCMDNAGAASVMTFQYSYVVLYPQFVSKPALMSRTATSLTVGFQVDKIGAVYCTALEQRSLVNTTSLADIYRAGSVVQVLNASLPSQLTLSGLRPDSEYTVVCYSQDAANHVMKLEVVRAASLVASTACCRSVAFTTTYPTVLATTVTTSSTRVFRFQLSSYPIRPVDVNFTVTPRTCDGALSTMVPSASASLTSLRPSQFRFAAGTRELTGSFVVRGYQGCYRISAVTGSLDTYATPTLNFAVINPAQTALPAPALLSAVLSSDGAKLTVLFGSDTNRPTLSGTSAFACSYLTTFADSAKSTCNWENATALAITLPSLPTVAPGMAFKILGGLIRAACASSADCTAYPYLSETTITVSAPLNPIKPAASLIAPKAVSYCSSVTLDATQSQGHGGRKWQSIVWSAQSETMSAANLTVLSVYMSANFQDLTSYVTVPNNMLFTKYGPVSITFNLALTNFLGQTSYTSATVEFNYVASALPSVSIYSKQNDLFYRWQPLSLFSTVRFSSCGNLSSTPLKYKWSVYKGTTLQTGVVNVAQDPRYLRLSPYVLDAGANYTVQVQVTVVTVDKKSLTAIATRTINVGRSEVVALLSAGATSTVSAVSPFTLDASKSYAVDYPGSVSALTFTWSCSLVTTNFGASCYGFESPVQNLAKWVIPPNYLQAETHAIVVTVSDAFGQVASATMLVTVVPPPVPIVVVAATQRKYNIGKKIILSARVNASMGPAVASWSSPNLGEFSTERRPLASLTKLSKTTPRGTALFPLSLPANTLTAGVAYTFTLQAAYVSTDAYTATTTVTILANAPPSGGTLAVTPKTGNSLVTQYTFQTAYWSDDVADYPIMYVFSYYAASPLNQNIVKASDTVQYVTTQLGQGLSDRGYIVTGIANASDVFGSYAVATDTTAVYPIPSLGKTVAEAVAPIAAAALKQAFVNRDASQVTQIVDASLSAINTIVCKPSSECTALNRESCRFTPQTCGPCLSGYIGPSGDSNIGCTLPGTNPGPVGAACTSNTTCLTGVCSAGRCQDVSKTCLSGCSGAGQCVFTDINSNRLSRCSILDSRCSANCVCNAGSYGRNCVLNQRRYLELLGLRESLCSNIYAAMAIQDVSVDVVRSRAESIGNALIDIDQISDSAVHNCTEALVETVIGYPALSCAESTTALVTTALSRVLARGSRLSSALLERVTQATAALVRGCAENSAVGEAPQQIVTGNMRMVSTLIDPTDAAAYTLTAAQDPFEALAGDMAPQVTLGSDASSSSNDGSSAIGLSLVQYTNNPRGVVVNSSSLAIRTTRYEESDADATRRRLTYSDRQLQAIPDGPPFSITISLPNTSPNNYFERANASMVVYCEERSRVPYYSNATCPGIGGMELHILCPAVDRGFFNVTCPGRKALPLCTTWNGAAFEVNPECEVVSYDATSTQCLCKGENVRRRFLQSSSGTDTAQEFSTTFAFFDEPYAQAFVKYPGILQVERNKVIFSTLIAVVAVFAGGLLCIGLWDKNELLEIDKLKGQKTHTVRTIQGFFNTIIPDEFRPGPWKELLVKRMMLEHSWLSVFGPYHEKKGFRMAKWALAMGKLFTYLLVTSIVASFIFADNGDCDGFEVRTECEQERSFGGVLHSCAWNPDNKTCVFNRPDVHFDTVILFVIVVAAVSAPLSHVIDILLKRLFRIIRARSATASGVIIPEVNIEEHKHQDLKEYWHLNDELRDIQRTRTKWFKAARLRKMQRTADFSLPTAETEFLMQTADEHLGDYGRRELTISAENFAAMELSPTVQHNRYAKYASSKRELLHAVQLARRRADYIRLQMEHMLTDDQREEYLLKQFVVDAFKGHQRRIASRYFLGSIQSTKRSRIGTAFRYASLLLLPIIFGALIYFILYYNFDIGSRATDLWLFVAFITLLEDVFFLQPLKIWLTWVVINSYVSSEAFKICVALKLRFYSIMNRRYGVMRDANSLVQHFNPACRAARLFPDLPVARFLMSVNDYDIPKFTIEPSYYGYPEPVGTVLRATTTVVAGLTQLPFSVQDSLVDIIGTVTINLIAISFYLLGRIIMGVAIALVVLLIIAVWLRETKYLDKLRKKKTAVDFKRYIPAPSPARVVPVDLVSRINEDFDKKVLFKSQFKALDEHEAMRMSSNTPRQIEEAERLASAIYPKSAIRQSGDASVTSKGGRAALSGAGFGSGASIASRASPAPYNPNESVVSMASAGNSVTSSPSRSVARPAQSGSFAAPRGPSLALSAEAQTMQASPVITSKSLKAGAGAFASVPSFATTAGATATAPTKSPPKSKMTALSLQALHDLELGTDEEVEKAELKALRRAAKKSKKRLARQRGAQDDSAGDAQESGRGAPSPKLSEDDTFSHATETSEQRDARRRYKRRKDKYGHKESDTGGPGISSARKLYSTNEMSGEEKGGVNFDPTLSVMSGNAPGAFANKSSLMQSSRTSQFPTWH